MKPFHDFLISRFKRISLFLILNFAFLIGFARPAAAQIQQAWVAHYNNGITNGQHQALKVALDSAGNIVICGFSQNTNGGTGYALVKYNPGGSQTWAARLDSTNVPQGSPASFAVDVSNNIVVTGNAGTAKYDPNGSLVWSNAYAGRSTATDTNCNVFIAFGTNFNTAKLSPSGTNLWTQTFTDVGPTTGRSIVVDSSGNCYVSGLDVYFLFRESTAQGLLIFKYDPGGQPLWEYTDKLGGTFDSVVRVTASVLGAPGSVNILFEGSGSGPHVDKMDFNGEEAWQASSFMPDLPYTTFGLADGTSGDLAVTGEYGTRGIGSNGACIWTNTYSFQTAIASDRIDDFYVTGASPDANGTNDIVTIAYDTNGKQLWLQRYTGVENYGAVGNAIAVDKSGNVYVAGYENVPGGGTEMVLIKYSLVTLQHQSNGDFLLQAQGAAGEPFDIQASTNLQSWSDLGLQDANTNGLLQYLDTNSALYPYRFYLAIPEP